MRRRKGTRHVLGVGRREITQRDEEENHNGAGSRDQTQSVRAYRAQDFRIAAIVLRDGSHGNSCGAGLFANLVAVAQLVSPFIQVPLVYGHRGQGIGIGDNKEKEQQRVSRGTRQRSKADAFTVIS